jgi:hypothetical protein
MLSCLIPTTAALAQEETGMERRTLLTLLVIPTVYEILSDWRDGLMAGIPNRRESRPRYGPSPVTPGTEAVRPRTRGP